MKISNNTKKATLTDKIIGRLKGGQVKMRPRIYFILRIVLIILITLFIALTALYLVSFIFFSLRASGVWFLPGFGWPAAGAFFSSLPWLLILVAFVLIVVLELLVKHFAFAYRRPILYSILAILVFAFLGSFIIGQTSFHPNLFWKAREGKLPMVGGFYRGLGLPKMTHVHQGIISEIIDNGFYLETPKGEILTVLVSSSTRSLEKSSFQEEDQVVILGERDDEKVKALGIRKVNDQFGQFWKGRGPHHLSPPKP